MHLLVPLCEKCRDCFRGVPSAVPIGLLCIVAMTIELLHGVLVNHGKLVRRDPYDTAVGLMNF